ncbi:MAG: DEAD/DEAH box helicase [Proteobacteria bacterium]|nr:DEAD/DEAH box helicase [Pseudomonadota bacterium]
MPDEDELLETSVPKRAEKPNFLTNTNFDEFKIPSNVLMGLKSAGFTLCTPIQARVLPLSLEGHDVAGQAQTGTGKTAAFLTTIASRLLLLENKMPGLPSALIVTPTRELAQQIYDEAVILFKHTELTLMQVIGGIDYQKQADTLKKGVDVVICTPGRIIDYFKQGIFKTEGIKIVVIDEADRLLDLGFAKDMRYILQKLPNYSKRQSMLFSATLSHRVLELTYEYMNLPEFISVTPEDVVVDGINQILFHVSKESKLSLLLGLLKREKWERILVFVNTKSGVEWLARKLKGNGYPAEGITGDLPQTKRFSLMERYKKGNIKILVATDVASRGIHVEDISHVFNYDLPHDGEIYVHRIGRTARAGKEGIAISLSCDEFVLNLENIENKIGYKIPVVWADDDWYLEDKCKTDFIKKRYGDKKKKSPEKEVAKTKRIQPIKTKEKIKKDYFPGTFFGFTPPVPEQQETTVLEDKQQQTVQPPKKHRYRKKSHLKTSEIAEDKET